MKWLLLIGLLSLSVMLKCQPVNPGKKYFEGYILSPDSMPVENAHIVSYLTLKVFITNAEGFFRIPFVPYDSFAVVHVSYDRKVVAANIYHADDNKFILDSSPYTIEMVEIKYRDMEMEYFEKNMAQIKAELSKELYLSRNYDFPYNQYAPRKPNTDFVEFNLPVVIDRIIQNYERLKRQFDD
ncbi:MAG: hypothetical protein JW798_07495 [Prolixibacteraceae bacterium]|nr:hypothetical protein [Prolixibacteraceae bacterium]